MSEDPFFGLSGDSTWNACIGPQGDELHYVEGYLEAAIELANAVIEKNMLAKRDTLVLPILYNARHAIELVLKFVTAQLFDCGIIAEKHPANHDIKGHFDHLVAANVPDETIRDGLKTLERFVVSLDRIDDDGQELRYHVNRDGETSLKGESLANIAVIRGSLDELSSAVTGLMNRTIDLIQERKAGAYTPRCSRADLRAIAGMMPPLAEWGGESFTAAKGAVKERFALSNTQFSRAIDAIKANRELNGMIGGETELPCLLDEEVMLVVEQWRILHPKREEKQPEIVQGKDFKFADMIKNIKKSRECVAALSETITSHEAADLEALFYLGRGDFFPEQFEARAATYLGSLVDDSEVRARTAQLLEKTNLLACLERGARRAGRLSLAEKLGTAPAESNPVQDGDCSKVGE
uniref:HEPN domain-containing protein n=1 Tax=Rhodopseudomonas palustris (strain BisA53) TaxID=316055 RepID=Q07SV8_RHOP5